MRNQDLKQQVIDILAIAGVTVNGPNPWDLQVHDDRFYKRVIQEGTLGLGEAYMDGWWDCREMDAFVFRVLRADLYKKATLSWKAVLEMILARLLNLQAKGKAAQNAQRHYDISNKLYQFMLDKRLNYSCGYWKNTDDLDVAQENKLDLICRKIGLKTGQTVLDIGCGWGG
ncbi:MAG TPA: class I SAM-dependent methyltransferase, partial [Adhaeribacter sp.]|nr:class I SAM-dependent methyltransferase [Adhaeribacter sp.]